MEEHSEELQNNGQAAEMARKQMQVGSELDCSYNDNNIHTATLTDPGRVI